jgi:hypothetical protein
MPNFCILNNKIITPEYIYKNNIDKNSKFTCYNCNKNLKFRQSRNADINYTEHFYHPNCTKGTTIECDSILYNNIKRESNDWHKTLSNFIKEENREIIRFFENKKHIVDAFDNNINRGIEFQHSPISEEDVISRDNTSELDWIFDVSNQYVCYSKVGDLIICEIPNDSWEKSVKKVKNNLFLFTNKKAWIHLIDRENYRIEIEGKIRHVWIGKKVNFDFINEQTCLRNIISTEGKKYFEDLSELKNKVPIFYARCKKSMYLLDDIYRNYINEHIFKPNEIIGIKAVAGSGKTTTLLNLTKIHLDKKILYIAFNKTLIEEIEYKVRNEKIKNITPLTFGALTYKLFFHIKKYKPDLDIDNLKPQFIQKIITFLDGKPYGMKKYYCNHFSKFLNDSNFDNIEKYCENIIGKKEKLLEILWEKVLQNKLINFEIIKKLAFINHWFKNYIDDKYDLIMIDETQDFDMTMLKMLLEDTTIPKIFVGDVKQSIYQFRGCINAFKYLPKESLIIEFYSTFRIGNPACDLIRDKFKDCWMISKSKNNTNFEDKMEESDNYVYLFRSWKQLLNTAVNTKNIFIGSYDKKKDNIIKLQERLQKVNLDEDEENKFEDDLPNFLKSLSKDDLTNLISNIDKNIVDEDDAKYKLYTVHSYKGMEDKNIRIANDVDIHDDENIYYVAITRGLNKIVIDKPDIKIENINKNIIYNNVKKNNNECYNCHKIGHFASECYMKKQKSYFMKS